MPNKGADIEKWLQDLKIACNAIVKEKIPNITKLQLYYAFTKVIAIIELIFTVGQEEGFIKLKEKGDMGHFYLRKLYASFETQRVQANREQIERVQNRAFASF